MKFFLSPFRRIRRGAVEYLFIVKNAAVVQVDPEAAEAVERLAGRAAGGNAQE